MTRFCSSRRLLRSSSLILPFLTAALLTLGGCAHQTPTLPVYYDADGATRTVKRVARNSSVNYIQRWSSKAYEQRSTPLDAAALAPDQRSFLTENGQPDYVRVPFRTQFRERAQEWVYLDGNLIAQFVEGQTVYVGPLTDIEQVLIQRGYPDYSIEVKEEISDWYQCFFYRDLFGAETVMYTFHRGKLLSMME